MVGILLLAVLQAAGMPSLHNFRSLSVSDGLSDLVVNACYKATKTGKALCGSGRMFRSNGSTVSG